MKKQLPKFLLLFVLLCTVLSCKKDHNNEEFTYYRIRINHYKQAINSRFIYVVQEKTAIGGDTWENKDLYIDDFTYEPGYVYDIEVMNLYQRDAALSSGLKVRKIIKSKVPEQTSFEVNLRLNGANLFTGNTGIGDYIILNKIKFDCGNLCTEFAQLIASTNRNIIGEFVRNTDGSYLLKGLKVK
ncbi:hypothetical protein [Pedobacter sp. Hv1]|uniref:hypothetical protein n=1 Tax=Pedobacter sp. Hv1 TaxID=1740090 RepID=UPI0006D8CE21|nr:hypothetical protein [Pedobacter sp. Hv1]KQC02165.1 hypothetical protein AQF98_00905 [Pedobacter sp. Hv1]